MKRNILIKSFFFSFLVITLASHGVHADGNLGTLGSPSGISDLGGIIDILRKILFTFMGVVIIGAFVYASILYMTSAGDPEKTQKSRSIILYGAIGLAVIALALVIIQIVGSVLGINLTNFTTTTP